MKTNKSFLISILLLCSAWFVQATCTASFSWESTSLGYVQFTNTSIGSFNPSYCLWRFGDGTTYTGNGPVTKGYSTFGNKNVCLILRDSSGVVCDSVCRTVSVDSCIAFFNVQYNCDDSVYIQVQHGLTTMANIHWGDGSTTFTGMGASWNIGNFGHRYTTSGLKTIRLTIPAFFGPCMGRSDTDEVSIMINIMPTPTFSTIQLGDSVFCTHTGGGLGMPSFGAPSMSWWNFGDGSSMFFGNVFPDTTEGHRYTSSGTYVIKHWITNFATSGPWCASDTTYDTVTITTPCGFRDSFYTSPASPIYTTTVPTAVVLFNASSGATPNTVYQIILDGAVIYTGNFSNYTFLINSFGRHNICLYMYDTVTNCLAVRCDSILVINPACDASYTYRVNCNTVSFTNTSTGSNSFYWSFGDGTTDTARNPIHSYTDTNTLVYFPVLYTLDTLGNICDSFRTVITIPHFDTIRGFVWNDANGNGFRETSESIRAGQQVRLYYSGTTTLVNVAYTNAFGEYMFYAAPGLYDVAIGTLTPITTFQTYPAAPSMYTVRSYGNCGLHDYLRIGVSDTGGSTICISGYVYEDNNNNGLKDVGEPAYNAHRVYIGAYSTWTNASGYYFMVVPRSTYILSYSIPAYLPRHVHTSPAAINLVPVAGVTVYNNNNFGINDTVVVNDLCVNLVPVTNVSPLGPIWYRMYVNNYGTTTLSGTATMYYDPRYVYNSSSPVAVHDALAHTVTYNFTSLAPGAYTSCFIRFNNPVTLVAGDAVFNVATVDASGGITEIEYDCNMDTLHQLVEASWDPNDKQVSPRGQGAQGFIADHSTLNYTIRFQNTGTAPAVNVVLIDTLSSQVDYESFRLHNTSHSVRTQLQGNVLKFYFDDIMLPDSASDPEGSMGYVNYSLTALPFLAEGTQITNNADIYFDLNVPVRTNTTLNTITYKLSVEDLQNSVHLVAYPNPFSDMLYFSIDGLKEGNAELCIYNIQGSIVKQIPIQVYNGFSRVQIASGELTQAGYIYQLTQDGVVLSRGKLLRE